MEFPRSSKFKRRNESVEGIQSCLEAEAINDAELQDSKEEAQASKVDMHSDHSSDESHDVGVGDDAGPPDDVQSLREFQTEVSDEFEAIQEMNDRRHQLEFIPSSHNTHGKPVDQCGYVIQKTSRPPDCPPAPKAEVQ